MKKYLLLFCALASFPLLSWAEDAKDCELYIPSLAQKIVEPYDNINDPEKMIIDAFFRLPTLKGYNPQTEDWSIQMYYNQDCYGTIEMTLTVPACTLLPGTVKINKSFCNSDDLGRTPSDIDNSTHQP